ncbi:hypothetical protein [Actinoplanes sp. DH11]|uniref:hypothetical protein n=1 Tax=Actinoplanes sp. DH11 TaxID=2857011 RepID=UPI001E651C8B|nr:hypothetical protein [Actinoplanes sp. DH11]
MDTTILIAVGWCIVITAGVLITQSEILTGGRDCTDAPSWCVTTEMVFTIGLTWGAPLWLGLMVVSSLVAIPMSRVVASAFWAGTLSTLLAGAASLLVMAAAFG